jgi:hypothetical protein
MLDKIGWLVRRSHTFPKLEKLDLASKIFTLVVHGRSYARAAYVYYVYGNTISSFTVDLIMMFHSFRQHQTLFFHAGS